MRYTTKMYEVYAKQQYRDKWQHRALYVLKLEELHTGQR